MFLKRSELGFEIYDLKLIIANWVVGNSCRNELGTGNFVYS